MSVSEFIQGQERTLDRFGVDAESRFIDVPLLAGQAHVLVAGEGPPVMMVIGGGMVAALWAPLMARLQGFTLYAVDPPGHGLTDATIYTTDTLRSNSVAFLDQVLDGLGLNRPAFIAQSMGGLWSTWLALDRPHRVACISYIGCPAFILGTSAPFLLRLSSIPTVRRLLARLQPPSLKGVDRMVAMAGEDLRGMPELRQLFLEYQKLPESGSQLLALHHSGVRLRGARPQVQLNEDELVRLTHPVQLIWGENDPFGHPSVGERAAKVIPDAELHVVGGGHGPWFTQSEAVAPIMTRFIHAHSGLIITDGDEPGSGTR